MRRPLSTTVPRRPQPHQSRTLRRAAWGSVAGRQTGGTATGRSRLGYGALLALALLLACGAPRRGAQPDVAKDSVALDAQYQRFAAAYPTADTATIVAMYEDSAAYLYGGRDIQLGRPAIQRAFTFLTRAQAAGLTSSIVFSPVRRRFHGDVAWSVSRYSVAFTRGPDTVSVSRGTALVVWRKDSTGVWRIAADAFAAIP